MTEASQIASINVQYQVFEKMSFDILATFNNK